MPISKNAKTAIVTCMQDRMFGEAGQTVVIEEWLHGAEVSVFGFTDGENLSALVAATDYKRAGEGDTGPNTGGMGSYGPPDFWNESLAEQIRCEIMLPVIREMASRGSPYRGALYCGLMLTDSGPRVLEFNCRFGDPETQVIMPRLISDPVDAMMACATGDLNDTEPVEWSDRPVVAVVMVSGGYPGSYETGLAIDGLDDSAGDGDDTLVFHAGVRDAEDGSQRFFTSGGRVLACVGIGDEVDEARDKAYRRAAEIRFEGAYYRRDIADLRAAKATAIRIDGPTDHVAPMTSNPAIAPDWPHLAETFRKAEQDGELDAFRKRRWSSDGRADWLDQDYLTATHGNGGLRSIPGAPGAGRRSGSSGTQSKMCATPWTSCCTTPSSWKTASRSAPPSRVGSGWPARAGNGRPIC